MPRASRVISITLHLIVLAGAIAGSIMAPGPLPWPRAVLAYDEPRFVTMHDIQLTPTQRAHTAHGGSPSINNPREPVPLTAPDRIEPGAGREAPDAPWAGVESVRGVDSNTVTALPRSEPVSPSPSPLPAGPHAPIRIHEGMQPPRKVVDVQPVYPPIAREARLEGLVILEAIIDTRGNVESVHVLRSIPLLDTAAVTAVKQWRFTPTRLNGEAVPVVMTVTVRFSIK